MDNSNKIVPPHLNAEIYRTDTTGTSTLSYLDYIRIHSDGSVLVGSSELTGRYWNGGASVFKDIAEARSITVGGKRSIPLTSGTADGCFIGTSAKVLLCEDNGAVSVWSTNVEQQNVWNQWKEDISVAEHDNMVLAVDCLEPQQCYVTAGADANVKVWDINDMICIRNYAAAHSMIINAVSVRPKSTNSFATGSMDQYVTLWDDNIDKPVLDLLKNDCCIRCIAWIDENRLIVGDEAGVLHLLDVRNTESDVKITEFPAAVHKLAVHTDSDKVAVCCDNKIVTVCEVAENSQPKVIYHDRHMHSNYVRGVAWDVQDKNTLHTVGWGGELKSHTVLLG
ncbi:methylosome protein WDR77 [Helicoverpa armigera]|uniref:methylosome protein WDR77 n=1 Tax=Helicoverpa armigera TaxID=29058 RepID=UPI003082E2D8